MWDVLVSTYESTRRHNPEEQRPYEHMCIRVNQEMKVTTNGTEDSRTVYFS
jgi:hypothetical protein